MPAIRSAIVCHVVVTAKGIIIGSAKCSLISSGDKPASAAHLNAIRAIEQTLCIPKMPSDIITAPKLYALSDFVGFPRRSRQYEYIALDPNK